MKHGGLLAWLVLALTPCLVQAQAVGAIVEQRHVPVARTVEAVVGPWMQKEQPPGAIVVVRCDGQTQFFPFGQADVTHHKAVTPDTVFELASITKVFTTTSLAMELEAGRMKLDDPVAQRPYFKASAKMTQCLAWQRVDFEGQLLIDKNGGLSGTSTYIGMLPGRQIGVGLMANRGKCRVTAIGRELLLALAGKKP